MSSMQETSLPPIGAASLSDKTRTGNNPLSSEVVSDPIATLAVPNGKSIQNCTELYMSGKGITRLADFERFENLDTLWLNDNKLIRCSGLDMNMRIQRLYLQNNKLLSLKGMESCTFLSVLIAYDNEISDLHATLDILRMFHHLEELDLHGNPLCEETNYRLHVIKAMPWVVVLDRHVVTDSERKSAAEVKTVEEMMAVDSKPKATVALKPTPKQIAIAECLTKGKISVFFY